MLDTAASVLAPRQFNLDNSGRRQETPDVGACVFAIGRRAAAVQCQIEPRQSLTWVRPADGRPSLRIAGGTVGTRVYHTPSGRRRPSVT